MWWTITSFIFCLKLRCLLFYCFSIMNKIIYVHTVTNFYYWLVDYSTSSRQNEDDFSKRQLMDSYSENPSQSSLMMHVKNMVGAVSAETLPLDNVNSTTFSAARQTDFGSVMGFWGPTWWSLDLTPDKGSATKPTVCSMLMLSQTVRFISDSSCRGCSTNESRVNNFIFSILSNKSVSLKNTFITWGVIFLLPLVPTSSSDLESVMILRVLQCTRMLRPLRCTLAGQALWTMSPCQGCTPEWLWRTPYSPSCTPRAHKSSPPRPQDLPRCWEAEVAQPGSTGHSVGHMTPPAGCRSALWCLRGHRCLQWHRWGGWGRPCSASRGPETWAGVPPTHHCPAMDHNSGHPGGMDRSDSRGHLRCRLCCGGLSQHGHK